MGRHEARKLGEEAWHKKRPGDDFVQERGQSKVLSEFGRRFVDRLLPYDYEKAKIAMIDVLSDTQFPKPGKVIDLLRGTEERQDTSEGAKKWLNGDVIRYQGSVGVVHRQDDYAGWNIPILQSGMVYWQDGTSHAGFAERLTQEAAAAWVRKWWALVKDDGMYYPGMEAAKRRFCESTPEEDAARLARIRATPLPAEDLPV